MSKCKICIKSVYPMDPQINLDGSLFHKTCAKCADCSCQITISNFTKGEEDGKVILLCKIHYFKRFKEGGSYVGGEKFQVKATRDVQANSRRSSTSSAPEGSSVPAAADASVREEESAAAGSVRERIASLKVTEKPKTENAPSSRRASFDISKSKSSDGASKNEPTVILTTSQPVSPVKAPAPAPVAEPAPTPAPAPVVEAVAPAAVAEVPPVPIVEAESAPVAAPAAPVEEAVIDASPENGVSTPAISAVVEETELAPTVVDAATEETAVATEESESGASPSVESD